VGQRLRLPRFKGWFETEVAVATSVRASEISILRAIRSGFCDQPSAFYGVSSVPLGQDALDVAGTNAGYYGLAGVDEIRAYFALVMHRRFLPSGRVRYFPISEYLQPKKTLE